MFPQELLLLASLVSIWSYSLPTTPRNDSYDELGDLINGTSLQVSSSEESREGCRAYFDPTTSTNISWCADSGAIDSSVIPLSGNESSETDFLNEPLGGSNKPSKVILDDGDEAVAFEGLDELLSEEESFSA